MSMKQGTNQIVDSYIGDKLIEARYVGQTKYFDAYTEITGTLPLSFNSRVAGALKNYRLYGDSDGAGVETENLVDVGQWLDDRGATYTFSDGTYTIDAQSNLYSSPCYFSQENIVVSFKGIISNVTASFARIDAINADGTLAQRYVLLAGQTYQTENISCAGFRVDWSEIGKIALSRFMVVKGSTAPTTFIPFGYKIPISNTSGVTENICNGTELVGGGSGKRLYFDKDKISSSTSSLYVSINSGSTQLSNVSVYLNSTYKRAISGSNTFTFNISLTTQDISDIKESEAPYIRIYKSDMYMATISEEMISLITPPDHYIPHRYTSNYDLFIGDSKLYEDEYLDFSEQKIYRTIILTTHDNKNFITSDNKRFCVRRSNNG